MAPFVAGLIVGFLVAAALFTVVGVSISLRRAGDIMRLLADPRPLPGEEPLTAAPFTADPSPLEVRTFHRVDRAQRDEPPARRPRAPRSSEDGQHSSGETKAPTTEARRAAGPPESPVERTHAMPAYRPRTRPAGDTGLDAEQLERVLSRGVARPTSAGDPWRFDRASGR
ncbi:hypothetical protein Psed_5751 [Pseudonocardia dioxanivorans CB1190]|uniref:Uncharacterized protein n=1 Tax=Pseudonocardia dioxanivorans (strain ATCC 55486 / DSM 44775 / JCM 13855 / CB1190) TaxID=675635 RepID=F4D190_PSEUX|nr:hypothetical protein [Pseudonocardia dioxanivorans]AEA27878.1 hypothetical protein Psed_5751 [Pseudonocardia dioxanivorans CB1190]